MHGNRVEDDEDGDEEGSSESKKSVVGSTGTSIRYSTQSTSTALHYAARHGTQVLECIYYYKFLLALLLHKAQAQTAYT